MSPKGKCTDPVHCASVALMKCIIILLLYTTNAAYKLKLQASEVASALLVVLWFPTWRIEKAMGLKVSRFG